MSPCSLNLDFFRAKSESARATARSESTCRVLGLKALVQRWDRGVAGPKDENVSCTGFGGLGSECRETPTRTVIKDTAVRRDRESGSQEA